MNKKYQFINNVTAWVVFLIAAITYISTAEPTVSFWDCGEFIAAGYKLEVGHPPGAPFFMLLSRLFTMFAFGDTGNVAFMVNMLSALASAFTILFLFWTITHIAKKVVIKDVNKISQSQLIRVMGAGIVGALAYAFSDSFWFSAVEGEVYALSSLFTAVVFWLILKWESVADQSHSVRWLVLIAFLMGLSIGVHLLNLLCIPAMVFVYYFKKYEITRKGVIWASVIAVVLLGAIMYGIIPFTVIFAQWFELFFVNLLGAPYNTGAIVYLLLLIAGIAYGVYYSHKHAKVIMNVILVSVAAVLIGYSTYAVILIRANADTPMDENNPDNVFSLLSYLNREQYGDKPLVFGQNYNSPVKESFDDKPVYSQIDGKYKVTSHSTKYKYDKKVTTFFPRMYSAQGKHKNQYQRWSGHNGTNGINVKVKGNDGKEQTINKPTFVQNLKYFWNYQLNWMYFRYFMWNFSGRQNERQGHGNILDGNWITGINFIDSIRLGSQNNLPATYKNDKSRNKYYMLPLILGLLGFVFLYNRNKKDLVVTTLLFFLTGIAIVIYLNQPPLQPRERDYAYVGSFYAFAIWIGLGVLAVYDYLQKIAKNSQVSSIVATVICFLAVPTIMASENYDDHDRSNLYTARDFSKNYLMSCEKNGILFTNGDNDTFPLWYMQEVEGFRTDVRVCNLSLLQTDWYIDQMKRQAYNSDALPISMTKSQYIQGTRDVLPVYNRINEGIDLKTAMKFVKSNKKEYQVQLQNGSYLNYFPTNKFVFKVNKENVYNNNKDRYNFNQTEKNDSLIPSVPRIKNKNEYLDHLTFQIPGKLVAKNHLAVLDMIQTNDWKRPIYFANLMGDENYLGLEKYFQADGLTYRLVPFNTKGSPNMKGEIEADILYDKVINDFKWGGLDTDKEIFLNENNSRMVKNHQNLIIHLAQALTKKANQTGNADYKKKAIEVLDKIVSIAPNSRIPYDRINMLIAEEYYRAGAPEKGDEEYKKLVDECIDKMRYFNTLKQPFKKQVEQENYNSLALFYHVMQRASQNKRTELLKKYQNEISLYLSNGKK